MSRFNQVPPATAGAGPAILAAPPIPAPPPRAPAAVFSAVNLPFARRMGRLTPFQTLGFWAMLIYVFARFSLISEILTYGVKFKIPIILVIGPAAVLLTFMTGGFRRFLLARPSYYVVGFMAWLVFVIPFATWRGGSFDLLKNAFMTDFSMYFMIVGLCLTWEHFSRLAYAIALGGAIDFLATRVYGMEDSGRFFMSFGTLMNPNDLATHLLITLPFCLMMFRSGGQFSAWKPLAGLGGILMIFTIFKTGSRGSLVALMGVVVYAFLTAPLSKKVALAIAACFTALVLSFILPSTTIMRYATIFWDNPDVRADQVEDYREAMGSQEARKNLLIDSVKTTLTHPLFGVGPGDYSSADAALKHAEGKRAPWQVTHNSYTEVSSEAGIPALIFFLGILITSYRLAWSVQKQTKADPKLHHFATAAYTLQLALVGFAVNIFFSAVSYKYYLPVLAALCCVLYKLAQPEIEKSARRATAAALASSPKAGGIRSRSPLPA